MRTFVCKTRWLPNRGKILQKISLLILLHDFVSQRNHLVEKCLYFSIGLRENSTSDDSEMAAVGTRNVEDVWVSVKKQKNYLKNSQGEFFSLETSSMDQSLFFVKTEHFSQKYSCRKNRTFFVSCQSLIIDVINVALCCSTSQLMPPS